MYEFVQEKFLAWTLVLTRVAGMFTVAPFFGDWFIPLQIKVLLAIFLSWLVLPNLQESISLNFPILTLVLSMVNNYLYGLIIGLIALLPLIGLSLAGEIFGTQMGFAMSSVLDPQREEVPLHGELLYTVGLFVFVTIKGHLLLYQSIVDSLKHFSLTSSLMGLNFMSALIEKTGESFIVALKFGVPLIGFMLVVSIALGILSRLVPQMNVFMVGLPLKVLVGMLLMVGLIPVWAEMSVQLAEKTINFIEFFLGR
ncbi:flagellar biosynthetic protein FliR [Pseudothermotoga sp.]|nr:flagellar biosynthetic protein FliR [Pseudothermotoga sp.]MCX7812103.1 flagellar biosynthetic protein FliR [Pseudothermotoga sp.]MDW8139173.1 flagellar biosynthetic protein FliR [Pseudothermotoga sp.]